MRCGPYVTRNTIDQLKTKLDFRKIYYNGLCVQNVRQLKSLGIFLIHSPSNGVGTMSLRLSVVKIFAFENTENVGPLAAELLEIDETC